MADIIETFADGTIIERKFTAEEKAQNAKDLAEAEAKEAAKLKAIADREAAQVKLAALGLTADELKVLGL
tara:strand:- start:13 stop:222 length:210 start_codon:yes stop_codon:yes gene_type:complete